MEIVQRRSFSFTYIVTVPLLSALLSFAVMAAPNGALEVPRSNQTFNGNIMFAGTVTDTDGSGSLRIRLNNDASKEISICGNCFGNSTNTRNFYRAGINPRDLGLSNGSHTAQLIEIDNNNETVVDSVNFRWSPPQVAGIVVNRTFGNIAISWSGVSGYNRYNLYISSEPNITPGNIDGLPDRTTYRSLTGTSQTITGYADELGLFGLITASNTSGEGAYSEVFRIEALDNQDPSVESEEFTLDEDTSIQGNILTNDSDPEGQTIIAELVAQPVSGEATLDEQGNFSYTPNPNFSGTDSFNYTVTDPLGGSGLGSVTFTVLPVNDQPDANDDFYETAEDELLTVTADQGVLNNDFDIDNDPLQASMATPASNGSVALATDGSFTYQPEAKFFGEDSFQYTLSDGQGGEQVATVTINVLQVNDLPIANDDQFETSEDIPLILDVTNGVLANDTDEDAFDGDITAELTVSLLTDVNNGILALATDGSLSYTPNENFFGSDSFQYQVTDSGGQTDTATAFIDIVAVNDAPLATEDSYEITEDTQLAIDASSGVLSNDSDIEDGPELLSATLLTSTTNGSLQLNSDGSFTYLPEADFFGTDSFTYQVSDSTQLSSEQIVSITVIAVNDPPSAVDDAFALEEDQVFAVTDVTLGLLANDSDPDLLEDARFTGLTVSLISAPSSGELSLESNGTFSYTPENNFFGELSYVYQISDAEGDTAQATVTLNIADTPDVPQPTDDSYSTAEEVTLEVSATEGVLANDIDTSGTSLTVSLVESTTSGTLNLNSDGSFTYQPEVDFFGSDRFSYQVTNESQLSATGNVTIEVAPVNDPPVAETDEVSVNEGDTIEIKPLDNDTDPDGDELTLVSAEPVIGSLSINGNTITYIAPAATTGENTTDTITYVIADAGNDNASGTILVTVIDINNAPEAQDDLVETAEDTPVSISPLENDSDADGDTLSLIIDSVTNGTAELNGPNVTFTPTENFNGSAEINYTVSDTENASDNAVISITVTSVNDLPIASDDSFSVNEGATISFSPLENDSDIEDAQLTITEVSAVSGTVTHNGSEIEYTALQEPGSDTINYTISDSDGGTDSAVINVTISDINLSPVANNDQASTDEDTQITIDVLANDTDADGDSLTVSINAVVSGSASVDSSNTVVYTPPQNFFGPDKIDYTITDPSGASDNAEIQITVISVNDPPVAISDTATVDEGSSVVINVLDNDTDVEGSALTITSATPSTGTVSIATDETSLTYTAPTGFAGDATISYFISDGESTSESAGTVTVTVADINFTPEAIADSFDVNAGETTDLDVLSNDTDTDGDTLTITEATATLGTVSISTDALTLSYAAPSDTTATDTISYTITDPSGATSSTTATVNITEQTFSGDFDTDGDGTSDVSASSDGTDYTVTFGSEVDAVYYEEDGETVSLSTNDSGVYELTIEGSSTGAKIEKRRVKSLRAGVKTVVSNLDFVLPSTTNQVFYTIDGTEYSFTVSNLDQPNANVAFGPPQKLDSDFGGATSHDFFLREKSFTGPLRLGVTNGEHYVLNTDGTGFVQGANFDSDVTWMDVNGDIEITTLNPQEEQLFLNVYDLDDDASDGIALNVITRAEADAWALANNDVFVEVFSTDLRQTIRLLNDNRVYVDAQIERYASYRIDATKNPEITSANNGVVLTQPVEVMERQLWDIENLKIRDISFTDLASGIATDVPRIQNNAFDSIVADVCSFSENTTLPGSGSGYCEFNDQAFTWQISNKVLNLNFGNDVIANYRWIDKLAVENTFAIEVISGTGTAESRYSIHAYWLQLENLTDNMISSLLTGNYFDSAIAKTNPGARDSNNDISTGSIDGFYFDASGLAKNLLSAPQFSGDNLFDIDQHWQLSNGDIKISGHSSVSNPNATFRYFYDLCTDTADENCFAWEVREWHPITIDGGKLWVWEAVIQNQDGPNYNNGINYEEQIAPRIQFYEFNSTVPGAPNSISFNQEPNWQSPSLTTELNTALENVDLTVYFADPESDPLSVQDVFVDNGTILVNSDNSVTYTPETGFSGTVNMSFSVSDGTNLTFAFGTITVQGLNVSPVAVDDTTNASTGFPTIITPLDNDTDDNNDALTIGTASAVNGAVVINTAQTEIEYTSNSGFTGTDTITYAVEDGRGGSDTGTITVTVSQPEFTGSYDLDNSGNPDFTIGTNGTDYSVMFGQDVSAVFYTDNGQTIVVPQNADGSFEFIYDASSTSIPVLHYVIHGVQYSISPDDLTLTTPNLVFGGTTDLVNDFGSRTSYELISRSQVTRAALSTAFENGINYSLQSGGTGIYRSPTGYDTVTWSQSNGIVTISFDNPTEDTVFFNVYDLDDDDSDGSALKVITKAEADAYTSANNTNFVDVLVSTNSHDISSLQLFGYGHEASIIFNQTLRIDSTSHPQITSANNGVLTSFSGTHLELLDTGKFDFLAINTSRVLGQIYLPVPRDNGSGTFEYFMSDACTLSETSTGSNSGTGSCSLSGVTFNWLLNSDGSMDASVTSTSGLSASYHGFTHGNFADTVYVEATDINGHQFSTLDYWFETGSVASTDVSALLSNNYMETSDNITNPFNYDSDGLLNSDIGNGFYFDNSGLAKELRTSIDPSDNSIIVDDQDRQWNVSSGATVDIIVTSNLSSTTDTYKYQYSQCTNSNDGECYIWAFKNWQPLAIDGTRIWVLDSDFDDGSSGFFGGLPINYDLSGKPKIRFYDVRSTIPGTPNSINFNQHPVIVTHNFTATTDTPTNIDLLASIGDPEGDPVSLIDVNVQDGSFVLNSDDTITYTPPTSFSGTTFIDIKVTDGISEVTLPSFITISALNNAPVAVDDTEFAIGSHSYTYNVLENDTDSDGDPLTISGMTTLSSGFSLGSGNTSINYDAPASLTTTATVTYTVSDGNGGTDTATLTVNLVPNSDPVVNNDSAGPVLSGNLVTLTPLDNDSDPDGDGISILSASSSDGITTVATDGQSLNFTPSISSGTASISYTVVDDFGGSATGSISVSVTALNNAPSDIILSNSNLTDNTTGTDIVVGNLTTSDADTGDSHIYSLVNIGTSDSGTCSADTGNSNFNINGSDLRTNSALSAASYDICVQTDDGTTTFQRTFTINITVGNTAPSDILLSNASINDISTGTDVVVGSLSTTDVDTGDTHTYNLVTAGSSANGTCSAGTGNGNFNINGSDLRTNSALSAATYDVCVQSYDGTTTFEKTLSITVSVGNNAPTDILLSNSTIDDTNTGTDVVVGSLSTSDADTGDAHVYTLVNIGTSANGTCSADSGNSSFNINGSDLRTNTALSDATYDVCVQSNDGTTTFEKTLSIIISIGNNAPTDIAISSSTIDDNTTGTDVVVGNLSTTDVDTGDAHTYSLVTAGTSANGTCSADTGNGSFNINGSDLRTNTALSAATYDVCVQSNDGTTTFEKTLSITISVGNNAPTDIAISSSTIDDNTTGTDVVVGNLSTTDVDTGDAHTYSLVTAGTSANGTCSADTGNGSFNINGSDLRTNTALSAATYDVCVQSNDGTTTFEKTLSITISIGNNAPTDIAISNSTIDDNTTGTDVVVGNLSTTDVDTGDVHSYSLVGEGSSANGTCSADTHNGNFNINGSDLRTNTALSAATYDVCVQSNDGTTTFEKTLSITVNVGNSAPTNILIDGGSSDSAADGATGTNAVVGMLTTTDVDGSDTHTYSLVTASTSANGTCSSDSDNGSFNINGSELRTNASLSASTYNVCVQSDDGTTTFQTSFTITISANTPTPTNDSYTLLSETSYTANIDISAGVLNNDSDPNAETLTASIVTNPSASSSFTLNSDGSFSYQHDGSTTLSDSFVYQVSDGTYSAQATASLTIKRANALPGVCTIPMSYAQVGEAFSQTIKTFDDDGQTQTVSISGNPAWLSLSKTDDNTSVLSGTPTSSDIGTTTGITFTSSDGFDTGTVTFDLTVIDEFATSSNVDIDFGGTVERVYDAAIDNFGKIVLVGEVDGDMAIVRLNRDGSFDTSFNSGAVKVEDLGSSTDVARAVSILPDNRILVGGNTNSGSSEDFALIMLFEDGTTDTSFGTSGQKVIDVNSAINNDYLRDMVVSDSGLITAIGYSDVSAVNTLAAVQMDLTGTLNSSFGTSGTLLVSGLGPIQAESAVSSKEGYIYVVGHAFAGADYDMTITRLNGSGLDTTFDAANSPGGTYYLDDSGDEQGYAMAFDKDGNILVVGEKDDDLAIYRLSVSYDSVNSEYDVAVDSAFNGATGKLVMDLGSTVSDTAYGIVSDERGNYYVPAKTTNQTNVIKISADGTKDTSYGSSGIKNIGLASGESGTPTVALLDAMGQMLFLDMEDPGSNDNIQITFDYILDPPSFNDCDYAGTFESSSHKTQDEVTDGETASDGDFFTVGWSVALDDSNKDFVAIKTTKEGDFDHSWGDNGYVRVDSGSGSVSIKAYEGIALSNKALVIAGINASTNDLVLAKLNSSGQLDSGFDSDGIRDFTGTTELTPKQGIYVSGSDTFLVAGQDSTSYNSWVYRFNADGTDDLTFGTGTTSSANGSVNYTQVTDANFSVYDMLTVSSGDIYLIGSYFSAYNQVAILKMDSSGVIDTGFGTNGIVTFNQGSIHFGLKGVTDGTSIYILGYRSSDGVAHLYKMDTSGTLDTGFDDDGILEISGYQANSSSSMQLDSTGDIWAQISLSGTTQSLVRIDSTGHYDGTFLNGGQTELFHGVKSWTNIEGFILDSNNEAFIFGHTNNDFALAMTDDIGFVVNDHNRPKFDFGEGSHAFDVELDAYSSPILAGASYNSTDNDNDMSLARFDNSGTADNTFDSTNSDAIVRYSPTNLSPVESNQIKALNMTENGIFTASSESINSGSPSDNNIFLFRTAPGTRNIDTDSYGGGSTDISAANSDDLVEDQHLADDGSLYVVGSYNNIAYVIKYDASGAIDSSFASSGVLELTSYANSVLTGITAAADGDLVASGYYGTDVDALVIKFSTSGTLNTSFDSDGIYTYNVTTTEQRFHDIAVGGNGVIYAVGEHNENALIVALDSDGTGSEGFNSTGILSFDVSSSSTDIATAVKIDQFGALFVVINVNNTFALYRIKDDGTTLTNFNGVREFSPVNKMRELAIDSLGNVFVTGSTQLDQQWQHFVVRFPRAAGPY